MRCWNRCTASIPRSKQAPVTASSRASECVRPDTKKPADDHSPAGFYLPLEAESLSLPQPQIAPRLRSRSSTCLTLSSSDSDWVSTTRSASSGTSYGKESPGMLSPAAAYRPCGSRSAQTVGEACTYTVSKRSLPINALACSRPSASGATNAARVSKPASLNWRAT
ncbi:hypothetical protein D3C85_1420170 [compost metagenome]